jgi:hypothetical protein
MTMRLLPLVLLSALIFSGCGGGVTGRYGVSGKVTLGGMPLDSGTIDFVAEDGSYQAGTTITAGKYEISPDKGLPPHTYIVRISSISSSAAAAPGAAPGPEAAEIEQANKERIPAEYNVTSQLSAKVEEGKPNKFDFAIP